jgi:glycosyltransferase involved in cell wall biosynthesis
MKILHVLTDIQIESGGVAAAACGMAEAIAARGHEVAVACLRLAGTPFQPARVTVNSFSPDSNSSLLPSKALQAYLVDHVRKFDIVHIHGVWQHPGHYAAAAARSAMVPYLVTPHGMLDANSLAMGRRWAKSVAWLIWDSAMVRGAAVIHCLNDAEIRCSPALRHMRNAIIGNGIPGAVLENLPPRGLWRLEMAHALVSIDRPIAIFLSRVHPKKGLERLLPEWPKLLQQHPNLLLVIAGTGDQAHIGRIRELIKKLGLDNAILLAGQISGESKWRALVDADVFVLPSYQEGFSMAITEAMAAGVPVVVTRECNFVEVEQAEAGVVVERGDMGAFVQAVGDILGNSDSRRNMGKNGRELVRGCFTWEAAAEKLERLYQAVIMKNALPADIAWSAGREAR